MRRKMIKSMLVVSGVFLGVLAGLTVLGSAKPAFRNGDTVFTNALNIPPLLEPVERNGKKVFVLTLQRGETEFFEGKKTATWGANGPYLMPTLRAGEGDEVQMQVTNQLGERTTIHWHGMHLPPAMDGADRKRGAAAIDRTASGRAAG